MAETRPPEPVVQYTPAQDLSGATIKGYELKELIGSGGFGAVYRAYQAAVDREVALKVVIPEHANNPHFIKRFESEAQVIARLEHLHIVPLYDYWREADQACLVMRWLKGGSLQDSIDQHGAWELNATARLMDQIASALSNAHRRGVIHRDLKPANILLDEEGNAYLADFGIAKILGPEPQVITDEDRFGSPAYISPEQVLGDPVSPQTDIYSLGVVLYMALTGRTPFLDPSTTTVIKRHLSEPLPPVQSVRPELPHAASLIVWKATSKRPEARYGDAMSMAQEFRQTVIPGAEPYEALTRIATPTLGNVMLPPGGRTLIVEQPPEPENPYKGLRAFQEADAGDFFGRDDLINRLMERLKETSSGSRFLAVIGPSGSGKSSAVRAGLIPHLRRGALTNSDDWFYLQIIPGANPIRELTDALLKIATKPPEGLLEQLQTDERGLIRALDVILPLPDDEVVLLIDQFEEVFTLVTKEAERTQFLNLLLTTINDPKSRLRVIITLRADMYDRPLLYPGIGELMSKRSETILPLSAGEIEEAIIGPATLHNLRFETGLVAAILTDVKQQPGALPLLQYALTELFERRDGFLMTRAGYQETGGVLGALASRADDLYEDTDSESQKAIRQMFLRLVTLGEGVEDTRRRVLRSELNAIAGDKRVVQEVIDSFGKYRLLTFDYEQGSRTPTVEVAHEALIRVWGRLRNWLNESRNDLRLHRRLSEATLEWIKVNRDGSYLAAGSRLAQFETLLSSSTLNLNEEESNYLWASLSAKQRADSRRRWLMIGLAVFALVALGLAAFAYTSQQAAVAEKARADQQASISRSRELAVTALTGVQQTDLALLLSLESLKAADTFEAHNSLLTSLQTRPGLVTFLHAHQDAVRAVAYSPDGKILASGSRDNSIILWDTSTHQAIGSPLAGHTNWVNSLSFSPDGKILASASFDGSIRLWDIETHEAIGTALEFSADGTRVWSVAFSPDGKTVAAGGADGSITLWNASNGQPLGEPLTGHQDIVYAVAFSPDGKLLASGSGDSTIQLWDTATWEAVGEPLTGHQNFVLTLAFSPDGQTLLSAGSDEKLFLWPITTADDPIILSSGHTNQIRSVVYSPDGHYFASGSLDGTIRLWDAHSGEPVGQPIIADDEEVWSLAFSPDNRFLASASKNQSIMLWDVETRLALGQLFRGHGDSVLAVAYSPDGTHFASAGGNIQGNGQNEDDAIHLWDALTGQETAVLSGHVRYVTGLAYSPDGKLLASGGADDTLRIWNTDNGENTHTIPLDNRSGFIALAFSPDSQTVAVGSDLSITLWNAQTGEAVGTPLLGHTDTLQTLIFSPDGKILASGGFDNTILLWDVVGGQVLGQPLTGHNNVVTALAFSPDGRILASGSRDASIILWDTTTRQPIGDPLLGHSKDINAIAYSPDGNLLASGSSDKTIILWNMVENERLGQPFVGHSGQINSLVFSPDGSHMVSGGQDQQVILWDVLLQSWEERACKIANRELTSAEWTRYFGTAPYRATCNP